MIGVDPVQAGLVVSLNRPGGNVTGITSMNSGLAAKQLGLLHQLLQRDARFVVLVNSSNPQIRLAVADVKAAAAAMGQPLDIVIAKTNREITPAFKEAVQKRADAILISPDPLFSSRPVQLATLAARHAMPAIYALREFAESGGLISYGSNFTDMFRQAGTYVARILKGEKPADLPILQATKFELVINLQTAEVLGLAVPPSLLADRRRGDRMSERTARVHHAARWCGGGMAGGAAGRRLDAAHHRAGHGWHCFVSKLDYRGGRNRCCPFRL